MSKDFIPSKTDIEAFGQAGTIINELTGELMKVEPIVSDMERIVSGIDKMVAGMEKMAKVMQPTTVQLNKPKFKKSVGALSSMFKTMGGLSPKAYVIQKLVETLSPLMKILEVFQPLLDAVSALLEIMVVSAMKPMYAVLLPLVPKIMELAPLFERIGTIIGEFIAMGLTQLVMLFDLFYPSLEPMLIGLAEFLEALKPLFPLMYPIIPLIVQLASAFQSLNIKGGGVVSIISALGMSFFNLMNLGGGLLTVINALIDLLVQAGIIKATTGTTTPQESSMNVGNLFGNANVQAKVKKKLLSGKGRLLGAQEGGTIRAPTIAGEAGAEEIVPLERKSIVTDKLDDMIYEQQRTRMALEDMKRAQERPRGLKKNVYG